MVATGRSSVIFQNKHSNTALLQSDMKPVHVLQDLSVLLGV